MARQQQQNTLSTRDRFNDAINLGLLGVAASSFSLEAFLRMHFGRRYMGLQAALVIPLVIVFALFWPHDNPLPLLVFLLAYIIACAMHRLSILTRRFKHEPGHTYSSGEPRLCRLLPWVSEVTMKRIVEPAFAGCVGVALLVLNEPLGTYICLSAAAMFLRVNLSLMEQQARELDMQDAIFERRQEAEALRRD